jgi:hypothetical protein
MSKKDFIALADTIKAHNAALVGFKFSNTQIVALGNFCLRQNPNFNMGQWVAYINGEVGPNGGKIK